MMQHKDITGVPVGGLRKGRDGSLVHGVRSESRNVLALPVKPDSPWFILRTMTGRELAVEKAVIEAGAQAIVLMRKGKERRRNHKLIPPRDEPLMTGYLLVRVNYGDAAAQALIGIEHVIGMLGGWSKPYPVSNEKVNVLIEKAAAGEFDHEKKNGRVMQRGEKVRITDTPFAGFEGVLISFNEDGTGDAVVEVDIFGRMTPMLLPLAILDKL